MGWLERLMGTSEEPQSRGYGADGGARGLGQLGVSAEDERALARYQYMLRTAPPDSIEQAHEEAFSRLTPEQRQQALTRLVTVLPAEETAGLTAEPSRLARAATRAEIRQPGTLGTAFRDGGGVGGALGGGMGGGGGSLLTGLAGGFIGSTIANSFFQNPAVAQDYSHSSEAQASGEAEASQNNSQEVDASSDPYGDPGMDDTATNDWGSGDFGGGDFGGGDFGGGDF